MSKNSKVAIQETYTLPSGGKLYGDNTIDQVTLRAMTTNDEKMRLSSTGLNVIPDLIKRCVVSPENLDVYDLKMFDLHYLMYKLRTVTYGPEYKLNLTCNHCNKPIEMKIDLDSIPVKEVPEDFKEPFVIGPLPVSGEIIEARLLSIRDFINIDREATRIKSKFEEYEGDPEYILNYKYKIVSIDGQAPNPAKIQNWIENLHARDARYFDSKYDEISSRYGMDLHVFDICPKCGEEIEFDLIVTTEFFRPKY